MEMHNVSAHEAAVEEHVSELQYGTSTVWVDG